MGSNSSMSSALGITKIIVDDIYNDGMDEDNFRPYTPGPIILGISHNKKVFYEWFDGITKREENGTLFLDNYHGKILVPRHCGLQIVDSMRPIRGLVGFPCYLDSYDEISIMIQKESGLELIVKTMGDLYINNRQFKLKNKQQEQKKEPEIIVIEGKSDANTEKKDTTNSTNNSTNNQNNYDQKKMEPIRIGKDFDEYQDSYHRSPSRKKPVVVSDGFGSTVDFGLSPNVIPIDVCMKYNLIALDTDKGDINIYYQGYKPTLSNEPEFKIYKRIRIVEHQLQVARAEEDWINVGILKKQLDKLYNRKSAEKVREEALKVINKK